MGQKGMDFKHKEVINIKDGKRLRICSRCLCGLRKWYNNIYNGCKKENRYSKFEFIRKIKRSGYVTRKGEKRTSYVIKDKFVYEVVCKVKM